MSCCQSLSNYNLSPGLNWSAFELKAKVGLNRVKIYMTISYLFKPSILYLPLRLEATDESWYLVVGHPEAECSRLLILLRSHA